MGTRSTGSAPAHAEPASHGPLSTAASGFRAGVPPHAELPLIRAFVESIARARDGGVAGQGEAPAMLRRTVETLAAILDLHGEFGAADEARAIVAALGTPG